MTMDAVKIDILPANKPFLNTKLSESSDNLKDDNDILLVDENDEDELLLRLSDDEDNEQDKTSGQVDSQQANLQIKRNEIDFVVKSEELSDCEGDPANTNSTPVFGKTNNSSNGIVDEDSFEQDCINSQDTNMSGRDTLPSIHNSPKFWPNNYEKRWSGGSQSRGRQNYSSRNANNWYNQQYPDKQFNNKQNYNNHTNNFKRRSSSRLSYNSPNNWNTDSKSDEKDDMISKKKISADDKTDKKNHTIQENGVSNNVESKENDSSLQNEKLDDDSNKVDEDSKNDKIENSVSSNHNCVENGLGDSDGEGSNKSDNSKVANAEENKEDTSSDNKHCDEEEKCESKLDKVDEQKEEGDSSNVNKCVDNDTEILSKNDDSKEESVDKESELKTAEVSSQNNDVKDIDEDSMDLADESETLQDADDPKNDDDKNDQSENRVNDEASAIELPEEESTEKNSSNSDDKIEENEDSNHSSESSKTNRDIDSNKVRKSPILNNEVMDVDDAESSNSVPDNSKEKELSEAVPMLIDDSSCSQQEEMDKEVPVETEEKKIVQEDIIEEVDLSIDDDPVADAEIDKTTSLTVPANDVNSEKVQDSREDGSMLVHKKKRRKRRDVSMQDILPSDMENGVRQKRRSAQNAEEMIRKEIMRVSDEEEESSDDSEKLVKVHYRTLSLPSGALSPPSLKRPLDENEGAATIKKIKTGKEDEKVNLLTTVEKFEVGKVEIPEKKELVEKFENIEKKESIDKVEKVEKKEFDKATMESIAETSKLVRKISQEDIRGRLRKLTQEEIEGLLVQKIVECITVRGEMGRIREQARSSQKNLEATRLKCQQLQKQVEGFDMVLKRITYDKNANADKYAPPIKINRSVGLQVNFVSDPSGITNLKQIAAMKAQAASANVVSRVAHSVPDNQSQSPRKTLKTRSPRRPDAPTPTTVQVPPPVVISNSNGQMTNKPSEQKRIITVPNPNIVQVGGTSQSQTVVVPVSASTVTNRQSTVTIQRTNTSSGSGNSSNKTSDLIDLTDEEDKSKSPALTPISTSISSRFPRVLQAVPASVALSNTSNLRLVQATAQGSQTAIMNNNRVTYVMQSGVHRQLVLTPANNMRPVTAVSARNVPSTGYKQNVTQLPNGAIRLLATQAPSATNVSRHPAPLPETNQPPSNPMWKSPPPAPSLKISKVATGIVLSWNMELSSKFAEIVSYQLYAYQEVSGTAPSPALWKKVGDVRALPLPMACTLTQFLEGNNYYFAVRAVDIHSRFGQYSKPGHISL